MININNVTVTFGSGAKAFSALSSISLGIEKGEHVAVLGPNGSGKSTLVKAICGLIPIDNGEISILGRDVIPGRFGEDFFGDVGVVFQEPQGQFIMPTVRAEIVSVLQNLGLASNDQRERLDETAQRFQLLSILDHKPESLSGGQMQIVNLACALCVHPQILILDEPTTFLDLRYRHLFMECIYSADNKDLTIIHVTQFPDEALRSQRVSILDGGALVCDGPPQVILSGDPFLRQHRLTVPRKFVCRKLFGFQCDDLQAQDTFCSKIRIRSQTEQLDLPFGSQQTTPVMSVGEVTFSYPKSHYRLEIDDLSLFKGQITGLVGPGGSGKSTLAFLLAGLRQPDKGQILYAGRSLSSYSIQKLRGVIGVTWQLPDLVMLGPTVRDDIQFAIENLEIKNVGIGELLSQVGLAGYENRIVDTLSGGEKRKLSLASILATNPEFVILDEPAAFLDPVSQLELADIIQKIANDGRGILLIGHDLQFIAELAQRIIGISEGHIEFDLRANDFFSDFSYLQKLGLPPVPMIGFRRKLRERGIALPFGSLDPQKIARYLKAIGVM